MQACVAGVAVEWNEKRVRMQINAGELLAFETVLYSLWNMEIQYVQYVNVASPISLGGCSSFSVRTNWKHCCTR